jgi:hypothetical protein
MELVSALRVLWRHRLLVALAAILGIGVALLMTHRVSFPPKLASRDYTVGIGSATALVDTPSSQVVDLGGKDSTGDIATLSARAALLSSLLTSSPLKDEIAVRAGVSPDLLTAVQPVTGGPGGSGGGTTTPVIIGKDADAHILKASVPNLESGEIPIVAVSTQAPTAAAAAKLANAAIQILQEHLASVASTDNVPEVRRVVVRQLGSARSAQETRGPGLTLAIIAGLMLFIVSCVSILAFSALARNWRRAAEMENMASPELFVFDDPAPEHAPVQEDVAVAEAIDEGPEPALEEGQDADAHDRPRQSNWASL